MAFAVSRLDAAGIGRCSSCAWVKREGDSPGDWTMARCCAVLASELAARRSGRARVSPRPGSLVRDCRGHATWRSSICDTAARWDQTARQAVVALGSFATPIDQLSLRSRKLSMTPTAASVDAHEMRSSSSAPCSNSRTTRGGSGRFESSTQAEHAPSRRTKRADLRADRQGTRRQRRTERSCPGAVYKPSGWRTTKSPPSSEAPPQREPSSASATVSKRRPSIVIQACSAFA